MTETDKKEKQLVRKGIPDYVTKIDFGDLTEQQLLLLNACLVQEYWNYSNEKLSAVTGIPVPTVAYNRRNPKWKRHYAEAFDRFYALESPEMQKITWEEGQRKDRIGKENRDTYYKMVGKLKGDLTINVQDIKIIPQEAVEAAMRAAKVQALRDMEPTEFEKIDD